MKEFGVDKDLFITIKDYKGRMYTFEVSKNPPYKEAGDESEYMCHPVLVDPKGTIIPYLAYKTFLKKKEFRIISRE